MYIFLLLSQKTNFSYKRTIKNKTTILTSLIINRCLFLYNFNLQYKKQKPTDVVEIKS